jgi:hypothetical protein
LLCLVPRRGPGHTCATPAWLASQAFLVLASGSRGPQWASLPGLQTKNAGMEPAFACLVPRRGLGHTGATPAWLVSQAFLVLARGPQWASLPGLQTKNAGMEPAFACLVPRRGLEPPRLSALVPETSASTNSATWAFRIFFVPEPSGAGSEALDCSTESGHAEIAVGASWPAPGWPHPHVCVAPAPPILRGPPHPGAYPPAYHQAGTTPAGRSP